MKNSIANYFHKKLHFIECKALINDKVWSKVSRWQPGASSRDVLVVVFLSVVSLVYSTCYCQLQVGTGVRCCEDNYRAVLIGLITGISSQTTYWQNYQFLVNLTSSATCDWFAGVM